MKHDSVDNQVYAFIRAYIAENGHPPTLREIAAALYLSTGAVYRCLDKLEAQGRITRKPNRSRGITLLDK